MNDSMSYLLGIIADHFDVTQLVELADVIELACEEIGDGTESTSDTVDELSEAAEFLRFEAN